MTVLDFDEAVGYLKTLLSRCDSGVLATCINVAAGHRNAAAGEPFDYAEALDGQCVKLVPNMPVLDVGASVADVTNPGEQLRVKVRMGQFGVEVLPAGYGDASNGADGGPVFIEVSQGVPVVHVWSDIGEEEPTYSINLAGAKLNG